MSAHVELRRAQDRFAEDPDACQRLARPVWRRPNSRVPSAGSTPTARITRMRSWPDASRSCWFNPSGRATQLPSAHCAAAKERLRSGLWAEMAEACGHDLTPPPQLQRIPGPGRRRRTDTEWSLIQSRACRSGPVGAIAQQLPCCLLVEGDYYDPVRLAWERYCGPGLRGACTPPTAEPYGPPACLLNDRQTTLHPERPSMAGSRRSRLLDQPR